MKRKRRKRRRRRVPVRGAILEDDKSEQDNDEEFKCEEKTSETYVVVPELRKTRS